MVHPRARRFDGLSRLVCSALAVVVLRFAVSFDAFVSAPWRPQRRVAITARNMGKKTASVASGMVHYPSMFPYLLVDAESSDKALAQDLGKIFSSQPGSIVDLVLTGPNQTIARSKLLTTLAKLPPWITAAAQIAPRRRDRRTRVRVINGFQVKKNGIKPEIIKASKKTDPDGLMKSLDIALKKNGQRKAVLLQAVGEEATAIAMTAIENYYFSEQRELTFSTYFKDDGNVQVLKILIRLEGTSDFDTEVETATSSDIPVVNLAPPEVPSLFPVYKIHGGSKPLDIAKSITESLMAHTARTVEVVVTDGDARGNLALALAGLPPWLQAVAQVLGRVRGKARVLVNKNFPLGDGDGAQEIRVVGDTDPIKLAGQMMFKLRKKGPLVKLLIGGYADAARAQAMMAIEHLQFMSKQEVSFKPVVKLKEKDGSAKTMINVLVGFT